MTHNDRGGGGELTLRMVEYFKFWKKADRDSS